MERFNELLRRHPRKSGLGTFILLLLIPALESYWGLLSKDPFVPAFVSWVQGGGNIMASPLSFVQAAALGLNFIGVALLFYIVVVTTGSDSGADIEELTIQPSFDFAGADPDAPPVYVVRHLHLLNRGADTVLKNWEMTVRPPGGEVYTTTILDKQNWQQFGALAPNIDFHEPVFEGKAVELDTQTPQKISVIAAVPGLARDDLGRAGTEVEVECVDGFGEQWSFTGTMRSRA